MTENDVEKIWVKNVIMLAWFSLFTGFYTEGTVLWLQAFVNRINGKQH